MHSSQWMSAVQGESKTLYLLKCPYGVFCIDSAPAVVQNNNNIYRMLCLVEPLSLLTALNYTF